MHSLSAFLMSMDNLSSQLNAQYIGCNAGDVVVNHMLYADDITLVAPSAKQRRACKSCWICVLLSVQKMYIQSDYQN